MQKTLQLANLADLDNGVAGVIIDAAIRDAVQDMDDRGEDGKKREVNIKITLSRMDNGLSVAHVEAQAKVPPRRSGGTVGRMLQAGRGSQMFFQTAAPDDPDQRTIDEIQGAPEDPGV